MVDDEYLNGYAKYLGTTASMVYISLCRHASKDQTAYPSQKLIGEELGINERIVSQKIRLLELARLIRIDKIKRKDGTWLNNLYTLLDKSEWRKPTYINYVAGNKKQNETTQAKRDKQKGKTEYTENTKKRPQPPTSFMYIKETHIFKDTHNNSASAGKIENIGQILKRKLLEKLTNGHSWQEAAERHYKRLGLPNKPPASWYKIFKDNQPVAEQAANWVTDAGAKDPKKLTYWKYNRILSALNSRYPAHIGTPQSGKKPGRGVGESENTHYRTPPEEKWHTPGRVGEWARKNAQSKNKKKRV